MFALVFLAFGVARNLPGYPFELLAPPDVHQGDAGRDAEKISGLELK